MDGEEAEKWTKRHSGTHSIWTYCSTYMNCYYSGSSLFFLPDLLSHNSPSREIQPETEDENSY